MIYVARHDNKTQTRGYSPEPNSIWLFSPALTRFGYGYGFSPNSKHRYEKGNGDIGTHPEPIPKPVLNVENQFATLLYR